MEITNLIASIATDKQLPPAGGSVSSEKLPAQTTTNSQDVEKAGQALAASTDKPDFEATANRLNELVQSTQRSIEFSVHESSGRTLITVRDKETGEEIRTIPGEEVLKLADYLAEILDQGDGLKPGILVSSQA